MPKSGTRLRAAVWLTASLAAAAPASAPAQIASERVASGLAWPVFVTAPAGDAERLFIVQQGGRVLVLKNGAVLPTPFLDISTLVATPAQWSEQGLLGLAFHPAYAVNGRFFVNYTNKAGDTVVARYQVSAGDPDLADPGSAAILLTVAQPYDNHNGGTLAFGPVDGFLYIGMGDGGGAGDPENRAQDDGTLLGKLLRIDVDGAAPYAIPFDNPFAGPGAPLDEIWAKGLRNPYRFAFDPLNGDLYVADVGQNDWEEVNYAAAGEGAGRNYGWRIMEGSHCYLPASGCPTAGLALPIHEYDHETGCSITGGAVYRGAAIPALQGHYFFADYCTNRIWSLKLEGGAVVAFAEWTSALAPGAAGQAIEDIAAIAPDGNGELYLVDRGLDRSGEIYRIVASGSGSAAASWGKLKSLYGGR